MSRKKPPVARKPSRKIADSRRVRYGAGFAPASLARAASPETRDAGKVRFGAGFAPASLRK
jgi:hypothetical protein